MTKREVVDIIKAYHPDLGADYAGCDDWKCGDPDAECTGVAVAMSPTVEVIKKAAAMGANLIIVHEPTFYTSTDAAGWFEDFPNGVYEEKRRLLDELGIAIWRDHDHMHAHEPDGIFTGVLKYLGMDDYTVIKEKGAFATYLVDLQPTTLGRLCDHLIDTIGLNGLRYIGDPDAPVSRAAFIGHLFPGGRVNEEGRLIEYSVQVIDLLERHADVLIPGETIDWTVLSYARDAVQLGKAKGVIIPGHYNWEELGMKFTRDWLGELLEGKLPVTYIPSEDMYSYRLGK